MMKRDKHWCLRVLWPLTNKLDFLTPYRIWIVLVLGIFFKYHYKTWLCDPYLEALLSHILPDSKILDLDMKVENH